MGDARARSYDPAMSAVLKRWGRDLLFHLAGLATSILGFILWVTGVSVTCRRRTPTTAACWRCSPTCAADPYGYQYRFGICTAASLTRMKWCFEEVGWS